MKQIYIIGGGTVAHIRPHLALCAPAYGRVVKDLFHQILESDFDGVLHMYTTKMAGNEHGIWTAGTGLENSEPENLETNMDIAVLLGKLVADLTPKIIFLPAALCDFDVKSMTGLRLDPERGTVHTKMQPGKDLPRLRTSDFPSIEPDPDDYGADDPPTPALLMDLAPAAKVISQVRKTRKDIFLVGFKTTTGATPQEQFNAGLSLVKQASCNLVLANDLETKLNMVVTPEQAAHYTSTDRRHTLRQLVGMTLQRAKGHFTRSEVVDGPLVAWNGAAVPENLRAVVNHCIKRGAYKPFLGKTVGHFAFKVPVGPGVPPRFITSRRGVDFNDLENVGMVAVFADGDDKVTSIGGKPSVGGQSQRIIFANHPELDCIVHMHVPLRPEVWRTDVEQRHNITPGNVPVRSQEPYECGSHECGQNTSDGLKPFMINGSGSPMLKAVMLDKHGPNIVFNSQMNPNTVIDFIERYWDLEKATSDVG